MSSNQAAAALGVQKATLYAYVSRGVITRHTRVIDGQRVSRFRREEVLELADQRVRPRAGALTTLIESDVTQLDADGALAFRGTDLRLCATWGFERTALHTLGAADLPWPDQITTPAPDHATPTRPGDVIRRTMLALAAVDPDRTSTSSDHCQHVAVTAVETSVRVLTSLQTGSVAERLSRWWARTPDTETPPPQVGAIDLALTALVDHELTASTLAARAAAGVRADPWMVLLTGLAAMSGPGQARASRAAVGVLRAWLDGHAPSGDRVPGFGHKVYVRADPRADLVLGAVADLAPDIISEVEALTVHVARTRTQFPNIDLALAALTLACTLPEDAGETIFTLARIPGLMAHAIEEYPRGLRLRPRALGADERRG